MTEAEVEDYTSGQMMVIPLDPRFTPIQNAQRYFKLYNKSRKTIAHLEGLIAANQLDIDYLESVLLSIQESRERRGNGRDQRGTQSR